MRKRYSEEDIKYIESQAKLGIKTSIIADNLGVSQIAIQHVLSRNKIKFCRNPFTPLPDEVWTNCSADPDIMVSNKGRFLRISTNSIISGYKTTGGYLTVDLSSSSYSAHRLIASAFIPNPEAKPEVNHKNGVKMDNSENNLEWVTPAENMQHAIKTGLKTFKSGQEHHRTAINLEQLEICSEMRINGKSYQEIGNVIGVHSKTVSRHLKNRRNTERSETIP